MEKFNNLFGRLKNLSIYVFERFLVLIYKENCCVCGCSKDNKILCKTCAKDVEILSGFPQGLLRGVEIYSACIYKGVIKELIHKLKFYHNLSAAKVLAEFLSEYYNKILSYEQKKSGNVKKFQNMVFIPVPTAKRNIKERGYNNVYEIVKRFAEIRASRGENIKILNDLLIKIKNTTPQYKINKLKRRKNVEGVFGINLKKYKDFQDKTFVIIDDIITTGSTLDEIIKTLQENNIKKIICITLSKAV